MTAITINPLQVTAPTGKIPLIIMDGMRDDIPAAFALMGTRAVRKVALRLAGGCKGMSEKDKTEMLSYFGEALAGYQGVIWSGATRQITENGDLDPMVTDVPGLIARQNPGCVALGTVPRTEILTLQGRSELVLDQWGTRPNPDLHGILIVQNGPEKPSNWDGDVPTYLRIMTNWQEYGDFSALGLIAWNGGQITEDEIKHSLSNGWLTVLVRGSGRTTDEVITRFEAGNDPGLATYGEKGCLVIVDKDDPQSLRGVLCAGMFLTN